VKTPNARLLGFNMELPNPFLGGFERAIYTLRKELPSLDIKKRNL
jgi:hypothetical protein